MSEVRQDREDWLESATAVLARAGGLLTDPTPESLQRCQMLLDQVRNRLHAAASQARRADPDAQARLRAGLTQLRKSLRGLHLLLEHAAGFYAGWTRLRNTLTSGYGAAGQPEAALTASRLSLEA